jgi:hypothetical protein
MHHSASFCTNIASFLSYFNKCECTYRSPNNNKLSHPAKQLCVAGSPLKHITFAEVLCRSFKPFFLSLLKLWATHIVKYIFKCIVQYPFKPILHHFCNSQTNVRVQMGFLTTVRALIQLSICEGFKTH